MTPTPASPPVDDRAEMEALLRIKHPDASDDQIAYMAIVATENPELTGEDWRILAHLRAEKAAAEAPLRESYAALAKDYHEDLAEFERKLLAAEAAVLERAKRAVWELQDGDSPDISRAEEAINALISPASLSALAERDARARNEALEEAAAEFDDVDLEVFMDGDNVAKMLRALKSKE